MVLKESESTESGSSEERKISHTDELITNAHSSFCAIHALVNMLRLTDLNITQSKIVNLLDYSLSDLCHTVDYLVSDEPITEEVLPFPVKKVFGELEQRLQPLFSMHDVASRWTILDPRKDFPGKSREITHCLRFLIAGLLPFSEGELQVRIQVSRSLEIELIWEGLALSDDRLRFLLENAQEKEANASETPLTHFRTLQDLLFSLNASLRVQRNSDDYRFIHCTFPPMEMTESWDAGEKPAEFLRNYRILIVEDEPINRMYLETLMKKKHWEVFSASNGKVALELCERFLFDLILMDVGMPVMDGLEATRELRGRKRSRNRKTPVFIMTAHPHISEKEPIQNLGIDEYILKPIHESTLLEKMEAKLFAL